MNASTKLCSSTFQHVIIIVEKKMCISSLHSAWFHQGIANKSFIKHQSHKGNHEKTCLSKNVEREASTDHFGDHAGPNCPPSFPQCKSLPCRNQISQNIKWFRVCFLNYNVLLNCLRIGGFLVLAEQAGWLKRENNILITPRRMVFFLQESGEN